VQIGDIPGWSSLDQIHQSANTCAELAWKAALLWTKEMDNAAAASSNGAVAGMQDDLLSLLGTAQQSRAKVGWDCG